MKKRTAGNLMLLTGSVIWGAAYVAQSVGMDYLEPFTFQACRCLLGSLVLLPVIFLMDSRGNEKKPKTKAQQRTLWGSGLLCGLLLFVACSLQQVGLLYTTAGKAGFFTSLYIVLVPIAGLFLGRRVKPWVWCSVILAAGGLYLLCGSSFSFGKGELLMLGCAAAFSVHILLIDRVSPSLDGIRLSAIQFLVCGLLSLITMAARETPTWAGIRDCWFPIAYAGILTSGVAYTFQILGQAQTDPTTASLLMSLESVFAVLFGWLLLGEALSLPEFLGCCLVFSAVILAQLPSYPRTSLVKTK